MALIDRTEEIEQRYLRQLERNTIWVSQPHTRESILTVPIGTVNVTLVHAIREAWMAGAVFAEGIKSHRIELNVIDIKGNKILPKEDHADNA